MLTLPESKVSYRWAQQHLAELIEQVLHNNTIALITPHQGQDSVALISTQELSNILETLALLRSPGNAQRDEAMAGSDRIEYDEVIH